MTPLNMQALQIMKELEDARLAPLRRKGVSRRKLRLDGMLGVDVHTCQEALSRKMGISHDYAQSLCHALCEDGFLVRTEAGRYTFTPKAIEAMVKDLSKRSFRRGTVETLLKYFR
ncbi:MAG: hypothetical protein ACE5JO_00495 [Candidatus Binatia bacterium]